MHPSRSAFLEKGLSVKFAVMQFTFMGMWTSFISFAILYLKDYGMRDADVGLLVVIYSILGFAGRFLWGYVCDRLMKSRPIFIGCLSAAGVLTFVLHGVGNIWAKILLYGITCFFMFPCSIIFDGWFFRKFTGRESVYGRIKGYGTVSLALTSVAMGVLIERLGWTAMFVSVAVFWAATLAVALITADVDPAPAETRPKLSIAPLIKNRSYIFIMLWTISAYGTGDMGIQFWPVLISGSGGTTAHFGVAMFLSAIAQTLVYVLLAKRIGNWRPKLVLALAVFFYIATALLGSFAKSAIPLILLYPIQGLGVAAIILASKLYVVKTTPPELKSSAQGVMEAFCNGFGGILGGALGGTLANFMEIRYVLQISVILLLLNAAVMFISDALDVRRRLQS